MKIRKGFVSNSSSSSFIIIGVTGDLAVELSKKDKANMDGQGIGTGEKLSYARPNCDWDEDEDFIEFDIAGLDCSESIKDKTYKEISLEVKNIIQKILGRKIGDHQIQLHYGESSDGG